MTTAELLFTAGTAYLLWLHFKKRSSTTTPITAAASGNPDVPTTNASGSTVLAGTNNSKLPPFFPGIRVTPTVAAQQQPVAVVAADDVFAGADAPTRGVRIATEQL